MLFLKALNFVDVNLTPFSLLLHFLLVSLLLLLTQQLDILDKWRHWVLLTTFLLLGHTLVNGVHEQYWVLDFGFDDGPQLLD